MTSKLSLGYFKNLHAGKDVVILTCGPSLTEYSKEKVTTFCKDKIVICIKEAVLEFPELCHYHVVNPTRLRNYDIPNKIIRIMQENIHQKYDSSKYNIVIPEDRDNFALDKQLLKKKNFEEYNFHNKLHRPWGPGILYETVFYLCHYMGIKNVYTIGWDLAEHGKDISHYFSKNDEKYKQSKGHGGLNYKFEMIMVNKEIPAFWEYFRKKGMIIKVCGHKSFVNKKIPRVFL